MIRDDGHQVTASNTLTEVLNFCEHVHLFLINVMTMKDSREVEHFAYQ